MNFIYLLFFLFIHQGFSKYTFLTTIYYNTSDYVNENFLKNNFINKNLICGNTTPILIIERDNNKSYNIVLSLNSTDNWLISTTSKKKNLSEEPFNDCSDYKVQSNKSLDVHFDNTFSLNTNCTIQIKLHNKTLLFYSLDDYNEVYSLKKFDGILSFNTLKELYNENDSYLIFNFSTNKTMINVSNENFVNITKENDNFIIDYILIGNDSDLYLAKKLKINGYFDSLSYYSFFPYSYIDYFLDVYFDVKDECKQERISNTNLYIIYCNKNKIMIHTIKEPISFIINHYRFSLLNLFSEKCFFKKDDSQDIIYFNILFRENSTEIVLGSNFLINKSIAYGNSSFYLYEENMKHFSYDEWEEKEKALLYIITIITFIIFLIILIICDLIKKKNLKENFEQQKILDASLNN